MPEYVIHLANGRELVLEGDQPPSDLDIESAATEAGVRSLLMSSEGESDARQTSNTPSLVSALGGVASAGMAAAPGIVAAGRFAAGKAVPLATTYEVGRQLSQGNVKDAAITGFAGAGAQSVVAQALKTASPYIGANSLVARMAAALRGASPYAAGASAIYEVGNRMGQHEQTLDPKVQAALRRSLDRDR